MKWLFLLLFFSGLEAVSVDLIDPIFQDGVLTTDKGGVIQADGLRIQARKICYDTEHVFAEQDLMIEYGCYLFVGKRMEYNFATRSGIVYDGRTGADPWFFGGDLIHLNSDGSYTFENGFATTSENYKTTWMLSTRWAHLKEGKFLTAKNLVLRVNNIPLFWLPSIRANVQTILDAPLRFTFRWGGSQGPRVGSIYEIYNGERWKVFTQLDYRWERGFGGGFETYYKSKNRCERFEMVNYIADDWTRFDQHKEKTRYRFRGSYANAMHQGKTTMLVSYDKLSDKDMATDYHDKGLKLDAAKPTELYLRRQETDAIFSSITRVRINDFQTVKQELPTVSASLRPQPLGKTGIIAEGRLEASYLEFEYQDGKNEARDYNSPRVEMGGRLYRPYHFGCLNLTPEAGWVSIWYGNNPDHRDRWVNLGCFRGTAETPFYRFWGNKKHVITPYASLRVNTLPSTDPDKHFIFDITDGWYKLNTIRFGMTHNFYAKTLEGCIYRPLFIDLWANAFYDTKTIPQAVQKVYAKAVCTPWPRIRHTIGSAWDFQHNVVDHFNWQILWTASDNAAIALEYRHRSDFDWRKVDKNNFILDTFRSTAELEEIGLSDRRDTMLVHLFFRFHPNWALQFQSRAGWRRKDQPHYLEYEADLLGIIRSSWRIKFSYRHRENEDRFFINLSLGLQKPDPCARQFCPMCLDF